MEFRRAALALFAVSRPCRNCAGAASEVGEAEPLLTGCGLCEQKGEKAGSLGVPCPNCTGAGRRVSQPRPGGAAAYGPRLLSIERRSLALKLRGGLWGAADVLDGPGGSKFF